MSVMVAPHEQDDPTMSVGRGKALKKNVIGVAAAPLLGLLDTE